MSEEPEGHKPRQSGSPKSAGEPTSDRDVEPESLVSEDEAEDEIAGSWTTEYADRNQHEAMLDRLVQELAEQGLSANRSERAIEFEIPAGRSHRPIRIYDEEAKDALSLNFSGWRSLERYDGIWSPEAGVVEVAIRGERFGPGLDRTLGSLAGRARVMGEEPPDEVIEMKDERSNVRVLLGRAFGVGALLLNPIRMRRLRPPLTLKIECVRLGNTSDADELVETVADSLSVQLGMRSGAFLSLRRLEARELQHRRSRRRGGGLQFPTSQYPHAPVALYQAGRERMTSPLLRYWAFYQVLEYFFPRYTRADSLQRVAQLVRSPIFDAHSDEDISRIVEMVDRDGTRLGEEYQLALCINAITSAEEVESFISESGLADSLANKKSKLSSAVVRIKSSEDLNTQLARRVYDIRCRIVHSKSVSQREGEPGLLPGTSDEDLVQGELPVIEFLAEKALVAASDKLDMRTFALDQRS